MPSILSCLDAESIIQKWQVVKEFSEIGNADTQAALKKSIEEWLRNQVPKPEDVDIYTNAGYRSYYTWQLYFAIANEFGIDNTFILVGLSEYVDQLHEHIKKWIAPEDEENWRNSHMVDTYEELLQTNKKQK